MTGQQGGPPGQGLPPAGDLEQTQVGMPVPPRPPSSGPPAYPPQSYHSPAPPPAYASVPPPPPPGYGPPSGPPPGGYPPTGYGQPPAPPPRRGLSPLLLGALALLLVVALGIAGLYLARIGPFAPAANPTATLIGRQTPTPSLTVPTATPTAAPTPTLPPTPTLAPTPTPTAVAPTAPPTASPTLVPSVAPTPTGDAEAILLSHVPSEFAAKCSSSASAPPALAAIVCTNADDSIVVGYTLFPDRATMDATYDFDLQLFAPNAGTDSCDSAANWPAAYDYTVEGEPAGRVFCADLGEIPQMYWTDNRFNILSFAIFATSGTREQMYAFWRDDSGPY